jgi:hypothetical protein
MLTESLPHQQSDCSSRSRQYDCQPKRLNNRQVKWKLWDVPFQTELSFLLKGMGSRIKLGALENKVRGRMNQNVFFKMWEVGSWEDGCK